MKVMNMQNDAGSMMTRDVWMVAPDDNVATVARLLAEHNISAAPVCDKDGGLLGMVSEGDLMRPFAETNELRRAWWLSLLSEGSELAPEFSDYVRRDRLQAQNLMTAPVITAVESTTLSKLSELMTSHRIKRVPIVRAGRVVGIVSRADLVRALSKLPVGTIDHS